MTADLPTAVWSGSFTLFGKEIRCHILDNGQRIIEADSVLDIFGEGMPENVDLDEVDEFLRWMRGMKDIMP